MNNCVESVMATRPLFQTGIGGSIPTSTHLYFCPVDWFLATAVVKKYHYLHRQAPISFAFGAFIKGEMVGVCTFGKPASHTLIEGVAGKENASRVFELNRLWMSDICPKNSESQFIGWCLKKLPKGTICVSYADTAYGHQGTVYKASNWIYTGLSIPFTDYTKNGLDHRSIPKEERIKEKMDKVVRSRKHRFVYFTDKKDIPLLRWKLAK